MGYENKMKIALDPYIVLFVYSDMNKREKI